MFWTTGAVLVGWFAVAAILASFNVYQASSDRWPIIQYGIAVPVLIGGFVLWRSAAVSRLIDLIPQRWIIAVQFYRALGVIFLILYASGKLSGLFARPAGAGEVAVGLLAPVVAWSAMRERRTSARAIWLWNVLGIADLCIAMGTGFLTSPSALQLGVFDRSNELIAAFPLVLIPTFLVPLSFLLHFVSLIKLSRAMPRLKASGTSTRAPCILDDRIGATGPSL